MKGRTDANGMTELPVGDGGDSEARIRVFLPDRMPMHYKALLPGDVPPSPMPLEPAQEPVTWVQTCSDFSGDDEAGVCCISVAGEVTALPADGSTPMPRLAVSPGIAPSTMRVGSAPIIGPDRSTAIEA
jgi:hypothetical protein